MRVNLLGDVEILNEDGTPAAVSTPKRRTLLAALALDLNQVVPTTRLLDLVWDGDPPPTARAALQGHVASLRRLVDGGLELVTREPGYLLTGDPELVDVHRFEALFLTALSAGSGPDAVTALREALSLWRGAALGDCDSALLREPAARRLDEHRLQAVEQLAQLLLEAGRGAEAVPQLEEAARTHPLRDSLAALLVRCLDQAGRRNDALEAYERARARLAADLGVAPGARLAAAHGQLRVAPEAAVPGQLPRHGGGFAGRSRELAWLDAVTLTAEPRPVLVTGGPGVGKTSLVLQWAHRRVDGFPDGQLFADLRGFDEEDPLDPAAVLDGFLRALGVADGAVPRSLDERSMLFRELLTDRRILVVLDNARSYEQVAPLLPDTPGTLVLVTSRTRLDDLIVREAAFPLFLELLTPTEALEVLGRVVGPLRLAAEPEAAAELVEYCDRLPLALRVAAARLASRPGWTLRQLADEIADEQIRLAALATDGLLGVASALSLTQQALPRDAARLFALLGLHPGAQFDPSAVAALGGVPLARARALLAQLGAAHLVQETSPGLFTRHDLVRLYTVQLAAELPEAEREPALERLIGHYLAAAVRASSAVGRQREWAPEPTPYEGELPALAEPLAAMAWFRREERALRSLVELAADQGKPDLAWALAYDVGPLYYHDGGRLGQWERLARAGAAAAESAGSAVGRGHLRADLGITLIEQERWQEAVDCLGIGLDLAEKLGDTVLGGRCRTLLAGALIRSHRPGEAAAILEKAVAAAEADGDCRRAAGALNNLAECRLMLGEAGSALDAAERSSALLMAQPEDPFLVVSLLTRAQVLQAVGRLDDALAGVRRALELGREHGNFRDEASCLELMGTLLDQQGRAAEAVSHWRAALDLATGQGRPTADLREKLAGREGSG